MKIEISFEQFVDAFKKCNRDNFTYDGYRVLFDELDDDEYCLDVIAVCCDYSEYTEDELVNDYGLDNTFRNMNEDLSERVVDFTDKTVILRSY